LVVGQLVQQEPDASFPNGGIEKPLKLCGCTACGPYISCIYYRNDTLYPYGFVVRGIGLKTHYLDLYNPLIKQLRLSVH
jgi:glutamine synthetase type III